MLTLNHFQYLLNKVPAVPDIPNKLSAATSDANSAITSFYVQISIVLKVPVDQTFEGYGTIHYDDGDSYRGYWKAGFFFWVRLL